MDAETANWLENSRQEMVQSIKEDPKAQPGIKKLEAAYKKLSPDQQTEFLETLALVGRHGSPFKSALTSSLLKDDQVSVAILEIMETFSSSNGPKAALQTVRDLIATPSSEVKPTATKLPQEPLPINGYKSLKYVS